MEHNGKKVELTNKDYTRTREAHEIEQLMQPNPRRTQGRVIAKRKYTIAKGKVYLSEWNGLSNPTKFDNFDGSKYKKDC